MKRFTKINGASLVSMMVGSVISVAVLMTAVGFYRGHILLSTQISQSSKFNSQLHFFLSALQTELAQVGYQIEPTAFGSDQYPIELSSGISNNLYWRYDDNGHHCHGFREKHTNDQIDNIFRVSLVYLEAQDSTCDQAVKLSAMNWVEIEEVALFQGEDLKQFVEDQWLVEYELDQTPCAPFGLNIQTRDRQLLSVESVSKGVISGDLTQEQGSIQVNKCLMNVKG